MTNHKRNRHFFDVKTRITRTSAPTSYSCICIAYFCESRRACLSSCTSCRARTTIQVSRHATNDGIINITLPEPRT